MYFSKSISPLLLAFIARNVLAVPLPQLAGEGAACNSILGSTDNGVGYGIEDAEDNVAGNVGTAKGTQAPGVPAAPGTGAPPAGPPGPPKAKRQLGGEGAACDSVFSSTDNGVGYGVGNAENNVAGNVAGAKGAVPGVPAAPPAERRQLDKIVNGAGAIGNAAGVGVATDPVVGAGDSLDGTTTGGAAMAGATVGDTEAGTLEKVGSSVP